MGLMTDSTSDLRSTPAATNAKPIRSQLPPDAHVATVMARRYVAVLAVIGTLGLAGYGTMEMLIRGHQRHIVEVERDAAQYMAGVRMEALAWELVAAPGGSRRDSVREYLRETIGLLVALHEQGIHSVPPSELPPDMRRLFFEAPVYLDGDFHEYFQGARTLVEVPDSVLTPQHPLLASLFQPGGANPPDTIAARLVRETSEFLQTTRTVALVALLIATVGLIVLALFVFRPLVRLVRIETALLESANVRFEQLALQDPLTNLANRRAFDARLDDEWWRAIRERQPLTLLMIDIDYFKAFNDRYGHPAGDACLKRVGEVLRSGAARAADFAARYGGEEFTLLLPGSTGDGGAEIGAALREKVEGLAIRHETSSAAGVITVSIGVATTEPEQSSTPEELVARADDMLYQAKQQGRNQVVMTTPAVS